MTIAIKPTWNPTTVTLTGLALLIEWPLALPVAAYAIWGNKLVGPDGTLSRGAESARSWFTSAARTPPAPTTASATNAIEAYRAERMASLDADRSKIDAEIDAFLALRSERQLSEEKEAFERFLAGRNGQPVA